VYRTCIPQPRRIARALKGPEFAGEEEKRVSRGRDAQPVDSTYHDPVITGGVLGDDLALERGEGVGQQRHAGLSELPLEAREAVRVGGGGAYREALVMLAEHVHAEASGAPHPLPGERAARRAERDQRRIERDRGE
jgi:hypothetical protein